MKLTVFGDVMWNYHLTVHPTLPIECNNRVLGGTLLNVCKAARKHFDEVNGVGVVGKEDLATVTRALKAMDVTSGMTSVADVSSGACALGYENGVRTFILSHRQANMRLEYGSVDSQSLLSSDFVFINGWSFLPESETSRTLLRLLTEVNGHGVPIIFDILPHHIQRDEINQDYLGALRLAKVVICETQSQEASSLRVFDISLLSEEAQNCDLRVCFDWTRKVRIELSDGTKLAELPTNYTEGSESGFLDDFAFRQILEFKRYVKGRHI